MSLFVVKARPFKYECGPLNWPTIAAKENNLAVSLSGNTTINKSDNL